MSEEYIVKNCAPTLAGLKTGNIYTCPMESRQALLDHVRQTNKRLRHKGVRITLLFFLRLIVSKEFSILATLM